MSARLDSSLRMTTKSRNALGFVRRHVEIAAPPPPLLSPSVFAETVKEMYDKILESANMKRTMAPNAWTWSMIENCKNREDIRASL
ncbi:hypothetical protein EUGRSUZ_H03758 [Eucalyptus grandis]|uniref:Uncharacterized protein n=2 Tax=Eucalyptus grandis TaxID=71139 RepID=A0ACC3JV05_EUCGR|nr:hypothetical protein EUGRSUZ_H03758 [Eucalyptus grandis]